MRSLLVIALVSPAYADDALTARAHAEHDEPLLELDPLSPIALRGLDPSVERDATTHAFDARTSITLEGAHWATTEQLDHPERPTFDLPARGWSAGLRFSRVLGPVRLDVTGSYDRVDSRFGSASYADLGISLTHFIHLSRWMTAWISLGIGQRTWFGRPPAGEANETQVKLSIGTTFR